MTQPSPAGLPTRVDRFRAMRAARFAAHHNLPPTVCPYSPTGTGHDRVLARVWVAEYLRIRPVPAVARR